MTDRELLELAAKAAGIELTWNAMVNAYRNPIINYVDAYTYDEWNPLTDDGDALRLAVRGRIDISEAVDWYYTDEEYAVDPSAATRRAIVRAAAEIGKATP